MIGRDEARRLAREALANPEPITREMLERNLMIVRRDVLTVLAAEDTTQVTPDPGRHVSDAASFDKDEHGFYAPTCACGWTFGPVPDTETLADVLMQHAYEAAVEDVRRG